MVDTASKSSRAKLVALISTRDTSNDTHANASISAFASTRAAVAPKIDPAPEMLALGTNEMVPSASHTALHNAFHSMRKTQDKASVDQQNIDKIAADAVKKAVEEGCKTQVENYIDTVLPARTNALFEITGERRVKAAVLRLAPTQIIRVVEEMAPQLVDHSVKQRVEHAINAEMTHIATALESTVHGMVRKELHGAFGDKVTQNIRTLIKLELEKLLAAKGKSN